MHLLSLVCRVIQLALNTMRNPEHILSSERFWVLKVSQDSVTTQTQKVSFNDALSLRTLKYWPPEMLKLLDAIFEVIIQKWSLLPKSNLYTHHLPS